MTRKITITEEYFRQYRQKLGFTNQIDVRNFFGAKDITPVVDLNYVKLLNGRLYEIADKIESVVAEEVKIHNLPAFKKEHVDRPFKIIKQSGILPILNNLGRRPEQVYFSWMRGYVISNYFLQALGLVFGVDVSTIRLLGDDDLRTVETFKKTPKADLEIRLGKEEKIRIEMQSGFTGTNDIKQHKVLEAKRVFRDKGIHTLAVHFDLYNGQAALVKLDEIEDDSVNWITRIYESDGVLFNIDQNYFVWNLRQTPPKFKQLSAY